MSDYLEMPAIEDFDPDEYKLLFMMLVENRGKIDWEEHLTPHGKRIFTGVQRKLGIIVAGIDLISPLTAGSQEN
jgi:hypothetical protein